MNILLVDDQVNMRRSTAYVLEQDGHVIFEAASGAAAMDIVASNDIDVVVTDVRMDGDSDGAALLKAVKTRHADTGGHVCAVHYDNLVNDLHPNGIVNVFLTAIAEHSDPTQIPVEYRPYARHIACIERGEYFCHEPRQTCR